jgi:3-dehydroquinate dehydratase I
MSAQKVIEVKGRSIGGKHPNICVPLVAQNLQELVPEATAVRELQPDMVEWRVDFFKDVKTLASVKEALEKVREILPGYPLIFTCRVHNEGGFAKIDESFRISLIQEIIATGNIDIVDIELNSGKEAIDSVIATARRAGVYVIVSYHDFKKTPSKEDMVKILIRQQQSGADIAKIAVMPTQAGDVLNLLAATLEFNENHARIPAAAMSMSGLGVVTRISGFIFGSTITFAAGKAASAPGQIPVSQLRMSIENLLNQS